MDGNWENLIYLLLLALLGIVGSFKKKKRPPVAPPDEDEGVEQPVQQGTDQKSTFDSIFETLLGQETPEPYTFKGEQETVLKESIDEDEELDLAPVPEQKNPLKDSIEYIDKSSSHSALDSLKYLYQEEEEEREEIDWRQAIIYKEILDRKYN